MTNKEMTELFSVMLLAWPNAEAFKGGITKLGSTIKLWTACAADVDFWTGQQAVIRLCKTCKFPPSIAEFLEQVKGVNDDIEALYISTYQDIRTAELIDGSLESYYEHTLPGSFAREAIDAMGGPAALIIISGTSPRLNLDGLREACRAVVRGRPTLVGGKPRELPGKVK